MATANATYVTAYDNGSEVRSRCTFDPATLNVADIGAVYATVSATCDIDATQAKEFVELDNDTVVEDFNDEHTGRTIVGGVAQDETDPRRAEDYD